MRDLLMSQGTTCSVASHATTYDQDALRGTHAVDILRTYLDTDKITLRPADFISLAS